MKNILNFFSMLFLVSILFPGCLKDECNSTRSFVEYIPVWVSASALQDLVSYSSTRTLNNPGKFYYYGDYILINELHRGVHVIDNSDIRNPESVGFIEIPGNVDMVMKGNILFADNIKDILLIDLSNLEQPNIVAKIEDVKYSYLDEQFGGRYLLYYEPTERTIELDCNDVNSEQPFFWLEDRFFADPNLSLDQVNNAGAEAAPGGQGIAGSLARFALIGDYFYFINDFSLSVYLIDNGSDPIFQNTIEMTWGIETIFPYNENLFIGANNGMHIFDNQDPANPVYISTFEHATACDPVVVQDDIAYVTLRDGNECQNFTNQLDVIDVSNLSLPRLLKSYSMHNPHGLSVRNDILYLCEGDEGLKVFDIEDKLKINENQLSHVTGIHGYDVISVTDELLLLIGKDGFYQYDASDPENLELLSFIEVEKS